MDVVMYVNMLYFSEIISKCCRESCRHECGHPDVCYYPVFYWIDWNLSLRRHASSSGSLLSDPWHLVPAVFTFWLPRADHLQHLQHHWLQLGWVVLSCLIWFFINRFIHCKNILTVNFFQRKKSGKQNTLICLCLAKDYSRTWVKATEDQSMLQKRLKSPTTEIVFQFKCNVMSIPSKLMKEKKLLVHY